MTSLRRTLLITLLLGISGVFLVGGLATYNTARGEIDTLMDYQLRQIALSLRDQQFGPGNRRPFQPPDESLDFVIQVWNMRGGRIYLSHPRSGLPALAELGYNMLNTKEGEWRVFSVPLLDHVIQVAQPMRVRQQLAADAAMRTLMPMLSTLPLLGILIWYLVGYGLRPLRNLAREVSERRADTLTPLATTDIPEEAQPLVLALNHLLERLNQAMSAQRAFVADAAHELRTPLTALQIQLQLTERAEDETQRKEALNNLGSGLQRATHLVQQLLTLARQEPGASTAPLAPTRLAEVIRQGLADHASLARASAIDLGATQLDDTLHIDGDPTALRTLTGNLIDNALRYTPSGGRVDVSIRTQADHVQLNVDDSGPGIPVEDRQRVLDRFYRRPGTETTGSGLGLAIVQRIVDRHAARLTLTESPLGGLRVTIDFPPTTP